MLKELDYKHSEQKLAALEFVKWIHALTLKNRPAVIKGKRKGNSNRIKGRRGSE
jgi:hypothetical protein